MVLIQLVTGTSRDQERAFRQNGVKMERTGRGMASRNRAQTAHTVALAGCCFGHWGLKLDRPPAAYRQAIWRGERADTAKQKKHGRMQPNGRMGRRRARA
eukprot:6175323-Pleurochrysis_carterae.AAC.1